MSSMNRVFIMGRLGQKPELRYTQNQTPVVTFSVATTEFSSRDGQKQETTEWHRIVVWGKQAENCAKYLDKGRSAFIEGRLQTRSWDDSKTGQKKYTTEILAQSVQFIGGSNQQTTGSSEAGAGRSGNNYPYGGDYDSNHNSSSSNSGSWFMDVDTSHLDDIPF